MVGFSKLLGTSEYVTRMSGDHKHTRTMMDLEDIGVNLGPRQKKAAPEGAAQKPWHGPGSIRLLYRLLATRFLHVSTFSRLSVPANKPETDPALPPGFSLPKWALKAARSFGGRSVIPFRPSSLLRPAAELLVWYYYAHCQFDLSALVNESSGASPPN
jgi:hypothetical protein